MNETLALSIVIPVYNEEKRLAKTFAALIPEPEPGATALDSATAKLVLSWATALVLADDERGLAALRRNFGPAMAGTGYKNAFTLLTSSLENGVTDLAGVSALVKEAEGFQSFLGKFQAKVKGEGLSKIN